MKKVLYLILLAAEFLFGAFLLVSAATLISWVFAAAVLAVWAALTVWQILALKKATEPKDKKKAKLLIALIMLLPAVASLTAVLVIGFVYF